MPSPALDAITDQIKKQKGEIALTAAMVAMADNKWKALGQSIKDIAVWKMIGPLGLILGATTGLVGAFRAVLVQTGSLEAALNRIAQITGLEKQFAAITKNATLAKERVAELMALSQRSPFDLGAWGQAGRALEILTRGAYSSGEALTTMGDAATATGNSIEEVSHATGALYEALREGQPAGAAAEQMRAMGLISEETAQKVVTLQESGAALSTTWGVVLGDLGKTSGSMKEHMQSVAGLQSAYGKAREALAQKFGAPFAAAELANIRNGTSILKALGPVVQQVSGYVAQFINPVTNIATKFGAWVLQLGGVRQSLVTAGTTLTTFVAGAALTGLASGLITLGKFVLGLGQASLAVGTSKAAFLNFATAGTSFKSMLAALFEGNFKVAGQLGNIALKAGVGATSLRLLGLAMRAVPTVALAVGVTEAIKFFLNWRTAIEETKVSVNGIQTSTKDMVSALLEQAAAVSTLEDKTRALASANEAVTEASKEYYTLLAKGYSFADRLAGKDVLEHQAALDKVNKARDARGKISALNNLAPTAEEIATSRRRFEHERHLEESNFQGQMERATPAEQIRLRAARIGVLGGRAEAGERGLQGRAATDRARELMNEQIFKAREEATDAARRSDYYTTPSEGADRYKKSHPHEFALEAAGAASRVPIAQNALNALLAKQEQLGFTSGSESLALSTRANLMEAGQQADVAKLRGDQGEYVRLKQLSGGLRGTPEQISALREQSLHAQALEQNAAENADRVDEMKQAQISAEKELAATSRRLDMETQIARLKSTGVDRADDEAKITREYLANELKIEQAKGEHADPNVVADLTDKIDDHDRATAATDRSFAVTKVGLDRQLAQSAALRKGDFRAVTRISDVESLASHFEELKGQNLPDDLAAKYAQRLAGKDIQDQATEAGRSVVVDSMQKIAGGGGVEATDPVLTVAQRQADLQAEMVEYLKVIAASSGKGDTLDPDDSVFQDY